MPVETYHICDVCGARTLYKEAPMHPLRITVDNTKMCVALWLVCPVCEEAILHAAHAAINERKKAAC